MKAIILAAGKGKRLWPMTKNMPKSMLEFDKIPLLQRIINIFKKCHVNDISIVVGHNADKITFSGINIYHNQKYAETNMLESLFCAEEKINDEVIISYADIIFEKQVLTKLLSSQNDISIVVDTHWLEYWKYRIENPLDDAHETVKMNENGYVIDIGHKIDNVNEVDGHFIGLMMVKNNGIKTLKDFYIKSKSNSNEKFNPLSQSLSFEHSRLVDLLQGLVKEGIKIKVIETKNGWLEFDTLDDYKIYSDLQKKNLLSNIIKLD